MSSFTARSGCPDQIMDVDAGAVMFSRSVVVGWCSGLPCTPAIQVLFSDGFESD
ncbi:MAG TPA: hypothetical protein VKN35_01085 [Xanthomonadales bacterium]|nr:hypothetical protein [Xanthomonadales bacterium]